MGDFSPNPQGIGRFSTKLPKKELIWNYQTTFIFDCLAKKLPNAQAMNKDKHALGTRYLTFHTLYGLKSYWVSGALLMLSGGLGMVVNAPFILGAWVGCGLELVFALLLFKQSNKAMI